MLRWSFIFLVIAIIAGVFGFSGIAEGIAFAAKIISFFFIVLFAAGLVLGKSLVKQK